MTQPQSDLVPGIEKVSVALGTRSYDIMIGADLLERAGELVAPLLSRSKTLIVTDGNVAPLHLQRLTKGLEKTGIQHASIILKPGEKTKSFVELEALCGKLLQANLERTDTLIALGGGVIGDLTGFASAILRRGMNFIQVPTTLLAQVDSSVGGKTGINMSEGKNLVGAFHQPRFVLADITCLETLSPRDFLSGYAEVIKYGLINDAEFFSWLDNNLEGLKSGDRGLRIEAVRRSCASKAAIISEDEREQGTRALLNLGHTFGHALEAETGYSDRLTHGEAVAIGMVLAHQFSSEQGLCPGQETSRVIDHLTRAGLKSKITDIQGGKLAPDRLLDHMFQDKKVEGGKLTFILTRGIGQAFIARDVSTDNLKAFLATRV